MKALLKAMFPLKVTTTKSKHMLVVGLGNPGPSYAGNRHNIGFMAVQAFLRRHLPSAPLADRFKGKHTSGNVNGQKVHVLLPQTYMNLSGEAVQAAASYYKIPPEEVYVVHDELDLPVGEVRSKQGGGHAGHNGLKNIIQHLGTRDFYRIRCGIAHPGQKDLVSGYVLSDFRPEERTKADEMCGNVCDEIEKFLVK